MNDLANTQQWLAARKCEEFGAPGIGGGRINFFVRIAEFDFVIAFQLCATPLSSRGLALGDFDNDGALGLHRFDGDSGKASETELRGKKIDEKTMQHAVDVRTEDNSRSCVDTTASGDVTFH
jgi:hypothetical protein